MPNTEEPPHGWERGNEGNKEKTIRRTNVYIVGDLVVVVVVIEQDERTKQTRARQHRHNPPLA
jgi:hypothetical protein